MEIRGYYAHLALMREGALDFTIQSPLFFFVYGYDNKNSEIPSLFSGRH
jgi:hypothetical protein